MITRSYWQCLVIWEWGSIGRPLHCQFTCTKPQVSGSDLIVPNHSSQSPKWQMVRTYILGLQECVLHRSMADYTSVCDLLIRTWSFLSSKLWDIWSSRKAPYAEEYIDGSNLLTPQSAFWVENTISQVLSFRLGWHRWTQHWQFSTKPLIVFVNYHKQVSGEYIYYRIYLTFHLAILKNDSIQMVSRRDSETATFFLEAVIESFFNSSAVEWIMTRFEHTKIVHFCSIRSERSQLPEESRIAYPRSRVWKPVRTTKAKLFNCHYLSIKDWAESTTGIFLCCSLQSFLQFSLEPVFIVSKETKQCNCQIWKASYEPTKDKFTTILRIKAMILLSTIQYFKGIGISIR